MTEIITVSEKARIQIQKLLEEQKLDKETHFLRVGVKGGGCSGMSYELGFDTIPQEGDNIVEVKVNQHFQIIKLIPLMTLNHQYYKEKKN